jgi:GrpB-like predicted nucleotidyltransferase (UPF0157 family)
LTIKNSEIAQQYAELKLKLFSKIKGDRDADRQAKSPFIDRVLQQAKQTTNR